MPLAAFIELLAARSGADLDVVGLPADRLPIGIGATVERRLSATLAAASGLRGRRLKVFKQQFGAQRRMLLECLDPDGPVSSLGAWQRFVGDVADVCRCLE